MKLAEQDAVRAQHVAELGAVVGNSGGVAVVASKLSVPVKRSS